MRDKEVPARKGTAPEVENQTDEPSQNEAATPQAHSPSGSRSSTKSVQTRSRHKRMRSESPTPQPRYAPARGGVSSQDSLRSVSSVQRRANNFAEEDNDLGDSDLLSEQRHLIDENAAAFTRFADPQTPPNRPYVLSENGLLMHLPIYEDSPSEQSTSQCRPQNIVFGDWLPGHGPQAHGTPSPAALRQSTRDNDVGSHVEMVLILQAFSPTTAELERERWGIEMAFMTERAAHQGLSRRQDIQDEETQPMEQRENGNGNVGSSSRPSRPWEL